MDSNLFKSCEVEIEIKRERERTFLVVKQCAYSMMIVEIFTNGNVKR